MKLNICEAVIYPLLTFNLNSRNIYSINTSPRCNVLDVAVHTEGKVKKNSKINCFGQSACSSSYMEMIDFSLCSHFLPSPSVASPSMVQVNNLWANFKLPSRINFLEIPEHTSIIILYVLRTLTKNANKSLERILWNLKLTQNSSSIIKCSYQHVNSMHLDLHLRNQLHFSAISVCLSFSTIATLGDFLADFFGCNSYFMTVGS